jgi:hypothetical protein
VGVFRRVIPGNGHPIASWGYGADAMSRSLAGSMAAANNPFSPMAAGVRRIFTGLPGFGVHEASTDVGPLQAFYGAVAPISAPKSKRLGAQAGPSSQPGMPSTGQDTTGVGMIGWAQLNSLGMGA